MLDIFQSLITNTIIIIILSSIITIMALIVKERTKNDSIKAIKVPLKHVIESINIFSFKEIAKYITIYTIVWILSALFNIYEFTLLNYIIFPVGLFSWYIFLSSLAGLISYFRMILEITLTGKNKLTIIVRKSALILVIVFTICIPICISYFLMNFLGFR